MPSSPSPQDSFAQASFTDLLFAPSPAPDLTEARLPTVPTGDAQTVVPSPAAFAGHTAYAVPGGEALRVGEEKERGKWGRGKPETQDERTARIEAQRNKADETHARVEAGLQTLAVALGEGRSAPLTAFLDSLARFHRYSWGNTLLIDLQRPDATLVAGFTTWKEMERYVKVGEKGIAILAPLARRVREEAEEAREKAPDGSQKAVHAPKAAGEAELRLTGKAPAVSGVWGFKVVYVFDVSQTEGKPVAELPTMQGDPAHYLPRLKALVKAEGIGLDYQDTLNGAFGRSYGGRIVLKTGMPGAQEFAILVHEFAHELLHPPGVRATLAPTVRETEAEAVAYVVSRAVGLEVGTASRDYIHLNQGDTTLLAASLERIQKTATRILAHLEAETLLRKEAKGEAASGS